MTPGPPATEDVAGQLAAMCIIPVVVLDDSAAAAQLAGTLADAEYGAAHGALVMTTPATAARPKKKQPRRLRQRPC